VLNALPARALYAVADLGGTITYWGWPQKRRAAHANYRVALGPVPPARLAATARRSFRAYARMIVDVIRLRALPLERLRELIKIEGLEHLEAARARGKGTVAVMPHVGNWEPASNMTAFLPAFRFLAVVDEGLASRAVAGSRRRAGIRTVEQSRAARATIRALRDNAVVLLAADLVKDFRAARVQLFGRETHLPAGPAYLAVRTGAALVRVVSIRQPDNTSVITCEPPLLADPQRDPIEEARRLSQAIADYFQRVIQRHPEQWYPYRPLWSDG
jgi:KDO2-lipid IV(A) lauroyltransferase